MSRRTSMADMSDDELAQWGIARKPPTPEVTSGRVSSHLNGAPALAPTSALSVFGQTFERALPRVLSLGEPSSPYSPAASRFPPGDARSFHCGVIGNVGWVTYPNQWAAAVLEYGAGASSHRVVFDWRPGNYNLPPCESVSLSVIPYGAPWADAGAAYTFAASCSPGNLADAHVPTVTGFADMSGPVAAEIAVPARARAVDVFIAGATDSGYVSLSTEGGFSVVRDYANNVFWPSGPAPAEPGEAYIQLGGEGTATVGVKFWLAL